MRVNIYKSKEIGYFTLQVSNVKIDASEILVEFLRQVEGIEQDSLSIESPNVIQFTFESSLQDEERQRELKISLITAVRKILGQDEESLKVSYMITQQQLEMIEKSFVQMQQQAIASNVEVTVYQKYVQRLEMVTGLSILTTIVAIVVAIVGILT